MSSSQTFPALRSLALCAALLPAFAAASTAQDAGQRKLPTVQPATTQVGTQPATTTGATQNPPTPTPAPRPQDGAGQQKPVTGPAPRLDVDATDHDFGTAIEGEKLTHTFRLKSSGQKDLIITSAKPTCGCTVAKLEVKKADGGLEVYKFGDPLPPGTDLELTAELDTKNKHQTAASKVNVYCDDPRTIVTLGLNARVDTYFQITPNALNFGDMSVADSKQMSFTVAGKKPGNFMLSIEQRPMPDGMKLEMLPREPDASGRANVWDVKVSMGPNCREGNTGYPINLRSDEEVAGAVADKDGHKATYGASVMVTARVMGLISYEPQYLSYGLVRPGQVVARSLTVKSFDPNFTFSDNMELKLVGPSDQKPEFPYAASFTHTVKPSEDRKSAVVELTLTGLPENVDGSFQGRLLIKTGHPQKPEIPVLFSGVCRPGVKTPPAPTPVPVGGEQKSGN
ncbi:MAG: DUF1573 domain-containing protein [Planctomycetes bacterium]|nr:DUF1573 domain-containing protein [Planctomycetota bacterium]